MRQRNTLAIAAAAALVALIAFGIAKWVSGGSDGGEASEDPRAAAVPVYPSSPGSASAAQQEAAVERTVEHWTPTALRDALESGWGKPERPPRSSTPAPSTPSAGGGVTAGSSPSAAAAAKTQVTEAAVAACKQPAKLKARIGYPYVRACVAAKQLGKAPSKEIGRLLSIDGDSYGSCTATVAETGITGKGAGNGSVVVTAGHCVGEAPEPDKPGSKWVVHSDPMFIPQPKVRKIHDMLQNPNVSWATIKGWLSKNAWFPRAGAGGAWIGYVPTGYSGDGDWSYDFATVVMAPRGARTIHDALGGLDVDMRGTTPKTALSLGYPSKKPFNGRTLFVCKGKVKVGDGTDLPGELGIGCDMSPGSSGGPWFDADGSTWTILSVNSYGPPEIMFGPVLNGKHWPTFVAARNYGTPG